MLQRVDRVIGLHRRQNHKRIAAGVMQQCSAGHRQIGDAPGAHQVAEIDDALQLPMAPRIALPHRVVVGDIHVNRLHRQLLEQRLQAALSLFGCVSDQCALMLILDHRQQMADQRAGVARIPLQRALKARMIKTGQRQIHLTAEPTKPGHDFFAQMVEIG